MARYRRRRRSYSPFRRFRTRHRKSKKIPLAPVLGLVEMFTGANPSGRSIVGDLMAGDMNALGYDAKERFTCIDNTGKFRGDWIIPHYGGVIAGLAAHIVCNKIGVNRAFSNVPIVGKYISI